MFAPVRGGSMSLMQMGTLVGFGGLGFILADGVDRFLATYDPSAAEVPKDKFTSNGTGTLANTLNIASAPGWERLGAGVVLAGLPAISAGYIKQPLVRASMQGLAIGAGINFVKTLWNGFLMPLLAPKDTGMASLQKSYVARLYPAEIAAEINRKQAMTAVSSSGSGALSGATETGVGDVGPFAVGGDSPYPDAAQALRMQAGVHDQYPSLQNQWGTGGPGSDYPTMAQAMRQQAGMAGSPIPGQPGVGWQPGPPSDVGPGPQAAPHKDPSCGCVGDIYSSFLGEPASDEPLYNTGASN